MQRKTKKTAICTVIVLISITLISLYIVHASKYEGNIFYMIRNINQLETDNDGVIKIGKDKYLTGNNEDIANLFQSKGYETDIFFTQCGYRKDEKDEYKRAYGKMFTSKYIIWTIPDSDLE